MQSEGKYGLQSCVLCTVFNNRKLLINQALQTAQHRKNRPYLIYLHGMEKIVPVKPTARGSQSIERFSLI